MIDETATNISYKVNGFAQHSTNAYGNQSSANSRSNGVKKSYSKESNDSHFERKENSHHHQHHHHQQQQQHHQTNGSTELQNGIHSSPLRSQLGLNLKSSTTPVKKTINPMTVSPFK